MNGEWITHTGGDCPVADREAMIEIKLRVGEIHTMRAGAVNWRYGMYVCEADMVMPPECEVVAYRTLRQYVRDMTESGDYYSATKEKWEEYSKAWFDSDYDKVMYFEEGHDPDFYYDPELPVRDR